MLPFPRKCPSVALALMVIAGAASTCVLSQGMVNRPQLSASLANELVGDTVAICAKQGYKVWAVVVNLDGVRQALLRGDGAPIHSQDNAYYKAYSAASITLGRNESSTKEVADRMAKAAPSSVPSTQLPNVTYGVGGVTIKAGGQAIGAIGVSGAPGGQFDEACARKLSPKSRTGSSNGRQITRAANACVPACSPCAASEHGTAQHRRSSGIFSVVETDRLTCGIQSLDQVTVFIYDLRIGVHLETAEGEGVRRDDWVRMIRRRIEWNRVVRFLRR
jgi:uncharacterized protein GlcG (DUF336 family)